MEKSHKLGKRVIKSDKLMIKKSQTCEKSIKNLQTSEIKT